MVDSADYSGEHADFVHIADPEPALGDNVLGDDGELVIAIPVAKYGTGKTATAQDSDLVAGNIKDAVSIFGVEGTYAGSGTAPIQSIQYSTVTIASGAASGTATITAVDTAKSLLIFLGAKTVGVNPNYTSFARIALTNSTTITAQRASGGGEAGVLNAYFVIIEFSSGIKSVQNATINISNDGVSGTATISAVDPSKSLLSLLGFTTTSLDYAQTRTFPSITLTNSTTITSIVGLAVGNLIIGCTLIEFL